MTIHRDINGTNIEIELTARELRLAFLTEYIGAITNDIKCEWELAYGEPFPYERDDEARVLASDVRRILDNDTTYAECYKMALSTVIEEHAAYLEDAKLSGKSMEEIGKDYILNRANNFIKEYIFTYENNYNEECEKE